MIPAVKHEVHRYGLFALFNADGSKVSTCMGPLHPNLLRQQGALAMVRQDGSLVAASREGPNPSRTPVGPWWALLSFGVGATEKEAASNALSNGPSWANRRLVPYDALMLCGPLPTSKGQWWGWWADGEVRAIEVVTSSGTLYGIVSGGGGSGHRRVDDPSWTWLAKDGEAMRAVPPDPF